MNINLVELITKQLGGDIAGKLGGMIGANADQTKAAVGAAVPTLLAGLANTATTSDGLKKLGDAISGTDSNILGNFAGMLGGGGNTPSNLAQTGTNLLGSLFGNNLLTGVIGALTKFTGLGNSSIGTLLGALAPMILGVIGKQQKTLGLDAGGLGNLLASQKNHIASAMPAGLGNLLGGLPGLGGIADLAKGAMGAAAGAAGTAASAARSGAAQAGQAGSNALGKILPLIIIAALAFLAWKWMSSKSGTPAPPAAPTPGAASTPMFPNVSLPKISLPNVDFSGLSGDAGKVAGQIKGAVENTVKSFGSIRDAASADTAIPQIREAANQLGALKPTWDGLPQVARTTIGSFIQGSTPKLQELSKAIIALPVIGEKVKPVTDDLFAKLAALK